MRFPNEHISAELVVGLRNWCTFDLQTQRTTITLTATVTSEMKLSVSVFKLSLRFNQAPRNCVEQFAVAVSKATLPGVCPHGRTREQPSFLTTGETTRTSEGRHRCTYTSPDVHTRPPTKTLAILSYHIIRTSARLVCRWFAPMAEEAIDSTDSAD